LRVGGSAQTAKVTYRCAPQHKGALLKKSTTFHSGSHAFLSFATVHENELKGTDFLHGNMTIVDPVERERGAKNAKLYAQRAKSTEVATLTNHFADQIPPSI
jgi:hypothetical protein